MVYQLNEWGDAAPEAELKVITVCCLRNSLYIEYYAKCVTLNNVMFSCRFHMALSHGRASNVRFFL